MWPASLTASYSTSFDWMAEEEIFDSWENTFLPAEPKTTMDSKRKNPQDGGSDDSRSKTFSSLIVATKGSVFQSLETGTTSVCPEKIIDFFIDTTPDKINKYMPGKKIPIKRYNKNIYKNIDYYLLGAWNFKKEIFNKEKRFINKGGKFITHVPKPKIIVS